MTLFSKKTYAGLFKTMTLFSKTYKCLFKTMRLKHAAALTNTLVSGYYWYIYCSIYMA